MKGHFINDFQSKIVKLFENTRKNRGEGGAAPSAPPLNPPMAINLIGSVNLCKVILTFKSVDEILACDL